MPYIPPILKVFGKSPFKPLHMHIKKVRETVDLLTPAVEAFCSEDFDRVDELAKDISNLEHECDIIKNDIREHLPRSILMPVNRGDLLRFLKEQDAMADTAEDVAVIMTFRRVENMPQEIKENFIKLTEKVVESVDALEIAALEIDELLESSFSRVETEKILRIVHKVDEKEWEADRIGITLVKSIYANEENLKFKTCYLKDLAGKLGEIADHAENAGDRMRVMMAR
ncbi:MAG: TIGR00153 family protein [Candidatus Altiarchaeales archaeon ex4484_2]|nr:MAG: TIGR00153 family protein [Candidatus Altiarchaeales archaeon ex4484_2]